MTYKIWVDDVRQPSEDWIWLKSTNEALRFIIKNVENISLISLDHDAGDFYNLGADYINVLNEMERLTYVRKMDFSHIKFRLHSANPVGVQKMRSIIQRNGWTEVF